MILYDNQVLDLLHAGFDTVPVMTCHMLGIPPTQPSKMAEPMRREYDRISQQLAYRLRKLERWHEAEIVGEPVKAVPNKWRALV